MENARTRILNQRTAALAGRVADSGIVVHRPQVIWALGDSLFGIDPSAVAAIIPYTGCTIVPGRQPACLGVMSRMGRFYSVIGLRRLLAMAEDDEPPRHLLLLRGSSPHLALAVDRVLGRFDVTHPAAADGTALVAGVAPGMEGRLVATFDVKTMLVRLGHAA